MNIRPIITPGQRPAISSSPIDSLATEPAMIIRIEGGIIVASAEVLSVNATA